MDKNLQQQLYGGIPRSPFSSSGGTRQSSVSSGRGLGGGGNKSLGGHLKKQAASGAG